MIGRYLAASGVAFAVLLSSPAPAQDRAVRLAHDAIAQGDYAAAERMLTAEQRIFPGRQEILLNLAAVYARTGRAAMAVPLYERVLASDDVLMDLTPERTASAHSIARIGLARLAPVQLTSR